MLLQRFTMGPMSGLAKVICSTIALLRFLRVVHSTMAPLAQCEPRQVTTPNSHSSEQGTLPTASLISGQAVPYRTRGGTCCPGVSTPMALSLADSSMTNHITWRILTVSTIPNLAQTTTSNLTTVTSRHDGCKTNTHKTQHKSNSSS
jgi:hypothetical protein